jgi:UDP-N-acetylmuramyl pentapeptide phosphotransferase/UDP-N-acetylglucosamine-1-phosphate transferase
VPEWIGAGLLIVWISGYTNAFNFMDGINGIAAGQAVLTGIGMALLTGLTLGNFTSAPVLLSLVIAGAALGFLPHNFPRARMFMGDVGSAPLGFLLATLVLWQARIAGWWLLVPLGLLHANFALDTGITLLRRMWCHKRWYEAHRDHFYQRFLRAGKTHQWITLWEMSLQALVLGLLLIYIRTGVAGRMLLTGIIIAIWLVFFGWAEIALRRAQGRQISPAGRRMSVSP